jgi:hypothetical protein
MNFINIVIDPVDVGDIRTLLPFIAKKFGDST